MDDGIAALRATGQTAEEFAATIARNARMMAGMDEPDLIAWLRAQLDDDERVAREATPGPWVTNGTSVWRKPDDSWDFRRAMEGQHGRMPFVMVDPGETSEPLNAEHIARWDPARVLGEVDAKRRIIDLFESHADAQFPDSYGGYASAMEDAVQIIALPYADRAGYRDEWRP